MQKHKLNYDISYNINFSEKVRVSRSTQFYALEREREKEERERIYVYVYLQEEILKNVNILTKRHLFAVLYIFKYCFHTTTIT